MKISIGDGCQVLCKDKSPKKVIQSPLVWHETDKLEVNSQLGDWSQCLAS